MTRIDYYKILQIDPGAENEVVRAAYRVLSRKYHPDGSSPEPERMRMLNEAHDIIDDPERRARYDLEYVPAPPFAKYAPAGWRPPPASWDIPLRRQEKNRVRPRSFGKRQNPAVYVIGLTVIACYVAMLITGAMDQGRRSAQGQPADAAAMPSMSITREEVRMYLTQLGYIFSPAGSGSDTVLIGVPECDVAAVSLLGAPQQLERMTIAFGGESSSQSRTDGQSECLADLIAPVMSSASDQAALVRWLDSNLPPATTQTEAVIGGWKFSLRQLGSEREYELELEPGS